MKEQLLTQEILKQKLLYDAETGIFTWILPRNRTMKAGAIAGYINNRGYKVIRVLDIAFQAHRLAWLYVYGEWPRLQIDHINSIRTDNRICNLREATNRQNQQNQLKAHSRNASGLIGASYSKTHKKWVSKIVVDGKQKHLGWFSTAEAAHQAYLKAKTELHPFVAAPIKKAA